MNHLYNELVKKPNAIHAIDTSDLVQKSLLQYKKFKIKFLTVIRILVLPNLISQQDKILLED